MNKSKIPPNRATFEKPVYTELLYNILSLPLVRSNSLIGIICTIMCFASFSIAASQQRVLYISSYHPGFPTFSQQVAGIRSVLNDSNILLDIEFMDTKRFPDNTQWEQFRSSLYYKIGHLPPYDLIIVADDNALIFALDQQHQLFKDIPIVFMGVNNIETALAQNTNPQITGVVEAVSMTETIELMIKLLPNAKKIVAIVDNTPSGQGDLRKFYGVAEHFTSHEFSELSLANQTWPEFLEQLEQVDESSVVLLLSAYKDKVNKTYLFEDSLKQIKTVLKTPLFHLWYHGIGNGIIGGKVISHVEQGKAAATIARKILSGTSVSSFTVNNQSPNKYVFDYSELQINAIDESLLPSERDILNKPESFYNKHKKIIWPTTIAMSALCLALLISFANILKRIKIETKLKESEEELRAVFEHTPISFWLEDFSAVKDYFDFLRDKGVSDIESYFKQYPEELEKCVQGIKISDINQATVELHQARNKNQLMDSLEKTFTPESLVVFQKEMIDIWNGENQSRYEAIVRTFNGEARYVTVNFRVAPGHETSLDKVLVTLIDNTERVLANKEKNELEIQLQQAQKMEAIGTLAGGIAHDFNNILAVILGYAEMAKSSCSPDSRVSKDLDQVLEGANRAKSLVQQILAFSRQHEVEHVPLQPAHIVKETTKILRSSLPTTIEIKKHIPSSMSLILADPTQIHQILMNLCTNAFHAMEETGGTLDISLQEVALGTQDLSHKPDVNPGKFIQLSVSDSGPGIPTEIQKKVFDPYFTTKETGKGTGMGLSIVHGIVKSYGGFISLHSTPEEGTTFKVYIPSVEKKKQEEHKDDEPIPEGREQILFIDDEKLLVEMGRKMLERLGYHVTASSNSLEALEIFKKKPGHFDLVITDQTMPAMTGADLAKEMIEIRPDIPIILCTGYSTTMSEEKAKYIGIKEFALKPLSKKSIAKLIRKVLNTH